MTQQHPNAHETPPSQDEGVGLDFAVGSETVLMRDFQDQDSILPSPRPPKCKYNPTVTQFTIYEKTATPSSASSPSQLNYNYTFTIECKPMSRAEIVRRTNPAAGTSSGSNPIRSSQRPHTLCPRRSRRCVRIGRHHPSRLNHLHQKRRRNNWN